jgi:transcriptional regulator with XRE-family HTH domain
MIGRMDDRRLGQAVRARRHRRGWRLVDLAARAGVGSTVCSLLEAGHVARLSVRTARSIAEAVDLDLRWDIGWQRQEIDRLLDADHSALAALWTRRLEGWGWTVRNEVSFNRYGDRGRIDLLAYHPMERVLLVIEIKTVIVDAQALLGGLDVKVRVAPFAVADLGWRPRLVVPALIVHEGSTARRHIDALGPLFARFSVRGHAVGTWLRNPVGSPTGMLTFTNLSSTDGVDARRAGRRRVRPRDANPRSGSDASGARSRPLPSNTDGVDG